MPSIQITLYKTDNEWTLIEEAIKQDFARRNLDIPKKGYAAFMRAEINRLFQDIEIGDCVELKQERKQKKIKINLSARTESKIICRANYLGIDPGKLISRMVLDPLIHHPK